MASTSRILTTKQEALAALAESRMELSLGVQRTKEQLSPKNLVQSVMQKHGFLVLGTISISSFFLLRALFPSGTQNNRDTSSKSGRTKRSIMGILISTAWPLARKPLLDLASQQLMPIAMQYLDKFQTPSAAQQPHSKSISE